MTPARSFYERKKAKATQLFAQSQGPKDRVGPRAKVYFTMAELDKQQSQCIRVREYDEDPSRERERGRVADNYHEYILEVTTEVSSSSKPSAAPSLQQSVVTNVSHLESNRRRRFLNAPSRVVQDLFLPIGFPSSVSPGYLEYQLYDSVQGLSSYLRGVLCNAQVLNAVGVGKAEATALSAAMTWAMKDG